MLLQKVSVHAWNMLQYIMTISIITTENEKCCQDYHYKELKNIVKTVYSPYYKMNSAPELWCPQVNLNKYLNPQKLNLDISKFYLLQLPAKHL